MNGLKIIINLIIVQFLLPYVNLPMLFIKRFKDFSLYIFIITDGS
jgi:hypothetical protein